MLGVKFILIILWYRKCSERLGSRLDVSIDGIFTNLTVAEVDVTRGIFGNLRIVRDENDSVPLPVKFLEENEHLEAGARIKVTCGLVGKQYGGVIHQGTGDGDTLHLST